MRCETSLTMPRIAYNLMCLLDGKSKMINNSIALISGIFYDCTSGASFVWFDCDLIIAFVLLFHYYLMSVSFNWTSTFDIIVIPKPL